DSCLRSRFSEGVVMSCRMERGRSFGACLRSIRFTLPFTLCCLSAVFAMASESTLATISTNENRVPAGQLEVGVLTLHLELRQGVWSPEAPDGRAIPVYAFAEEGHVLQTPAPLIRVPQGTELRVCVHNLLSVSTRVYGLHERPAESD